MKNNIIAVAALASISSFAAYAGSGCSGMKSVGDYHQMSRPVVTFSETPLMSEGVYMKVGGIHHNSNNIHKTVGYGYGVKQVNSNKADIVDTAVAATNLFW